MSSGAAPSSSLRACSRLDLPGRHGSLLSASVHETPASSGSENGFVLGFPPDGAEVLTSGGAGGRHWSWSPFVVESRIAVLVEGAVLAGTQEPAGGEVEGTSEVVGVLGGEAQVDGAALVIGSSRHHRPQLRDDHLVIGRAQLH